MALSSPGIGSNLNVSDIVSKLMSVEAQPLTQLAKREASYQAKLSAFGTLSGALGALQSSLATLVQPSKFRAYNVAAADTTIVNGSATASAAAGTYNVNVIQLARGQVLMADGVGSSSAAIGAGSATITLEFGAIDDASFTRDASRAPASVTIDASNNTLQGVRDAINGANLGATASIISDGSGQPYRLVLSSGSTGAKSNMKVSVSGNSELTQLMAYDPTGTQNLAQTSAAQDTMLTVNGITVVSPTQTVSEAIQGTTLNVNKIGTTTLTIARDTASLTSSLNGFVGAYNSLQKTISSLTAYDPVTKAAGTLNGDASARRIQHQVRSVLANPLQGTGSALNNLTQLGVSINKDGVMTLDNAQLQKTLTQYPADVGSIFATLGRPSDSLVNYTSATKSTRPGSYALQVSQLATQGALQGSADLSGAPTEIDSNTVFTITLDGNVAEVSLPAGSYDSSQLATALQSAINANTKFSGAGSSVAVSVADGRLKLQSGRYGSASGVSIAGNRGTAASALLGTPAASNGVDAQGTIGGVPATGSGKFLTAGAGSNAEGLKLEISSGTTGERGLVAFSSGYAAVLDQLVTSFISSGGSIAATTSGLNASIKEIGSRRTALNLRLLAIEKRYLAQFSALDVSISSMNSTANFLTQQLNLIASQSVA